jgi:hypothetical protein
MDLRHQARQRFINDVAFGSASDAETLMLVCECGRSDCHDFVTCRAPLSPSIPVLAVAVEPKGDTEPDARSADRIELHAHARISDPKPPRNPTTRRDSSKPLKRRFSKQAMQLATRRPTRRPNRALPTPLLQLDVLVTTAAYREAGAARRERG